jgi:hypothetical protein
VSLDDTAVFSRFPSHSLVPKLGLGTPIPETPFRRALFLSALYQSARHGEVWNTPELKADAFSKLRRHGYQPQPLRGVYLPKSSDPSKLRPLGIPP